MLMFLYNSAVPGSGSIFYIDGRCGKSMWNKDFGALVPTMFLVRLGHGLVCAVDLISGVRCVHKRLFFVVLKGTPCDLGGLALLALPTVAKGYVCFWNW
jgi:hypothetical protein